MTARALSRTALAATTLALVAAACADSPTVTQPDAEVAFAKGGSGKPGTGSGPNATISVAGGVNTGPSNVTTNALIVRDNKRQHETDACCNEANGDDGDPFFYYLTLNLAGTAPTCETAAAQALLNDGAERDGAVIAKVNYTDGTAVFKFIWNDEIDGSTFGPFAALLSGPVVDGGDFEFTLGTVGGSVLVDWPSGYATANGLPETESCTLADIVTIDVDPL